MSTRLYFLVDDENEARSITELLRDNGIDDDHLMAVADRENYPLEDLPEGGIMDRTDIVPAAGRGFAVGGGTGLLAGLGAMAVPGVNVVLAGGAMVAALTAAGAAVGTWASTLVGIGVPHHDLQPFEEALAAGRILLLVDVEDGQSESTQALIRKQCPDIVIASGELEDAEGDPRADGADATR